MNYLKTYENFNLEEEYIKIFGNPETQEDIIKMRRWIEKFKNIGFDRSFDEMKRIANTGEFHNRLKTWENQDKVLQLKKDWEAKNGKPDTPEKRDELNFYIRKMLEEDNEMSLNYFGEETRQIPHF
jgi:hypothetical protein